MIPVTKLPEGVMPTSLATQDVLVAFGFNHAVAEALEERERSYAWIACSSPDEVFNEYLEWNGIIGHTESIRNALDNIRNVEAL